MLDATFGQCELLSGADERECRSLAWGNGIGSLYTMLRFYADDFVGSIVTLQKLSHVLQGARDQRYYDDEGYDLVRSAMTILSRRLADLNMATSVRVAQRVIDASNRKYAPRDLESLIDHVSFTIKSELESMLLFEIPKHRSSYYRDALSILDEKVSMRLTAVLGDVEEASRCFAVGRYTACVLHLMRAMETSVQQLGKKLKVKLVQEKNWQNIIDEINMLKICPQKHQDAKRFNENMQVLHHICLM